jgi:uncharacterized membrane protein
MYFDVLAYFMVCVWLPALMLSSRVCSDGCSLQLSFEPAVMLTMHIRTHKHCAWLSVLATLDLFIAVTGGTYFSKQKVHQV